MHEPLQGRVIRKKRAKLLRSAECSERSPRRHAAPLCVLPRKVPSNRLVGILGQLRRASLQRAPVSAAVVFTEIFSRGLFLSPQPQRGLRVARESCGLVPPVQAQLMRACTRLPLKHGPNARGEFLPIGRRRQQSEWTRRRTPWWHPPVARYISHHPPTTGMHPRRRKKNFGEKCLSADPVQF